MLLEDMSEVARFNATVELQGNTQESAPASAAEIRLYKSNLAVLPAASAAFQWRLADIDNVTLDTSTYEVVLQAGGERLKITRLARRTEEFAAKTREAMQALVTRTAQALHIILPFLDPDQLQACAGFLREGHSASLTKLAAIHKQIPAAFAANAVDKNLKPYYDMLTARAAKGEGYAGFKLIRSEDADSPASDGTAAEDEDDAGAADADATGPETLYWFLFPLAQGDGSLANVVAWEASSKSGRATYFFRMADPAQVVELTDPSRATSVVDSSIRGLNRVLGMLNFRRRPIYLSDDDLAMNPLFHRYAIAARRLPEVRKVRAGFLGRALHSSPEAWQTQVENILANA